jgi:hypothetical protein
MGCSGQVQVHVSARGTVLKRTERLGLEAEGHSSRFGCYLLDDRSGMFVTGYLAR